MGLHWTTEKCKDRADHDPQVLEALIWACMSVDLPKISNKNLKEWIFRLAYLRHIGHASFKDVERETAESLEPYIGLSTNVAPLTRAQWLRKNSKWIEREVEAEIRRVAKSLSESG